jgi:hypothetical protein
MSAIYIFVPTLEAQEINNFVKKKKKTQHENNDVRIMLEITLFIILLFYLADVPLLISPLFYFILFFAKTNLKIDWQYL